MEERIRLRPETLEWREVEGEIVVLDLEQSLYMAVNRTGSAVWSLLVEGASRGELIDRLVDQGATDRDQASADLESFLSELDEHGLTEAVQY